MLKKLLFVSITLSFASQAATHRVYNTNDFYSAVENSVSGDLVAVYSDIQLSRDVSIPDGVRIWGSNQPVISSPSSSEMLWLKNKGSVSNIKIHSVVLDGVGIDLRDSLVTADNFQNFPKTATELTTNVATAHSEIKYVTFRNGKVDNDIVAAEKAPYQTPYVYLSGIDGMFIFGNQFSRASEAYLGKGIKTTFTANVMIANNSFTGHMKNAVNGLFSNNHFVNDNYMDKVNITHTEAVQEKKEDHGIYIAYFDDVSIKRNRISNWSNSPAGGSIKFRNGENGVIADNEMHDSGLFLSIHNIGRDQFKVFKNIQVKNNEILLDENSADNSYDKKLSDLGCIYRAYHGIDYTQLAGAKDALSLTLDGNRQYNLSKSAFSGNIRMRDAASAGITHGPETSNNIVLKNNAYATGHKCT